MCLKIWWKSNTVKPASAYLFTRVNSCHRSSQWYLNWWSKHIVLRTAIKTRWNRFGGGIWTKQVKQVKTALGISYYLLIFFSFSCVQNADIYSLYTVRLRLLMSNILLNVYFCVALRHVGLGRFPFKLQNVLYHPWFPLTGVLESGPFSLSLVVKQMVNMGVRSRSAQELPALEAEPQIGTSRLTCSFRHHPWRAAENSACLSEKVNKIYFPSLPASCRFP